METQSYRVLNTHANEISGWTILYRLLHLHTPHLGGINGDVQSDLSTLEFKNGEQLEYFHSIIIRMKQEIFLSGETASSAKLILQYMKEFLKNNKQK